MVQQQEESRHGSAAGRVPTWFSSRKSPHMVQQQEESPHGSAAGRVPTWFSSRKSPHMVMSSGLYSSSAETQSSDISADYTVVGCIPAVSEVHGFVIISDFQRLTSETVPVL
uniref:Uncharacterized protein n=1 Tax=Knipowitschia caucasica TaxID=637954 RepID=A0AAV2MGR1_KNICA